MDSAKLIRWLSVLFLCLSTRAPGADPGGIIAHGAVPVKISGEFLFTEGPATDKDGNIFFTDQPNDRIVRYDTKGEFTDWLKPAGRANGTYFDRAGNLLVCADEKNELWSISPEKEVTVLVKNFREKLLNGPNDLWITPAGNIYFTDPLYKRGYWKRDKAGQQPGEFVYFMERKTGALRPVELELKKPNGIIGTPDGKVLYVADLDAGKTYSYRILEDGTLTGKKLFCALGSDGMTIDNEGNVYLTGKGVTVFNARGEQIEHIAIPEPWSANITFGGKDGRLLFITAGKAVYGLQMRVSGGRGNEQ